MASEESIQKADGIMKYPDDFIGKVIEGDCLEVMKKLPDHSVDAMITDPPFAFTGGYSMGRSSMIDDQFFLHWWKDICIQLSRILKEDGEGFIWCDWKTAATMAKGFVCDQKYTWRISQILYHYREMPGQGRPFRSSVDMIAYCRGPKSKGKRISNTTHNFVSKYWYYGKHKYHPAEKDSAIAEKLVEWSSDKGDVIIDPFLGSATTAVAAAKKDRRWIGIEKEPKYCEIARQRLSRVQKEMFT